MFVVLLTVCWHFSITLTNGEILNCLSKLLQITAIYNQSNNNQFNMPLASLYWSISSLGAWWAKEHCCTEQHEMLSLAYISCLSQSVKYLYVHC